MEYARLELRFTPGGWSSGTLITGLAGEGARGVRGVLVRPFDLVVTHTLLTGGPRPVALPSVAQVAGDTGITAPEGSVRLVKGASVTQGGKRVGQLSALWCDRATGRIMHVLARPAGGLLRRPAERVLSVEEVSELTSEGLVLGAGTAPIKALTPYRADREIEADLRLALAEALHAPSARRGVKLLVEAGRAHLGGLVETEEEVSRACDAARSVRGVRSITMDLVSTETLGTRVEQRLAAVLKENEAPAPDPTTEPQALGERPHNGATTGAAAVRVLAEHGIVYLEGRVATKGLRAALERAALAVAGARVVVNYLEVELDPQLVLAQHIGQNSAQNSAQSSDQNTGVEAVAEVTHPSRHRSGKGQGRASSSPLAR